MRGLHYFLAGMILTMLPSVVRAAPTSVPEPTLCSAKEQIIFSCATGRQKIVSLCASGDLKQSGGRVQYRFGKPGNIELSYPEKTEAWKELFTFSAHGFSGGGEYHIRFVNNAFEYLLYDQETRPQENSGLLVRNNGKVVSHLKCVDGAHSFISHLAFESMKREPYGEDVP